MAEDNTRNPIFVIGAEHSGTTILYRMLAKHSAVCWFSQYSMRGGEVPSRFRVPFYNQINKYGNKLFPITWRKRFGLYEKLIPSPSEPHKIWEYLLPDEKQFFDESDFEKMQAQKMKDFIKMECDAWGKDVLITKLPRLTRAVAVLKQTFPDAHFVHIIRDGKAVALSNRHKFARHTDSDMQALKDSANYWKEVVDYIGGQKEDIQKRYTEIRYEDVCVGVHSALKEILSDIGMPAEKISMEDVPEELTVTNHKHFDDCPKEDKRVLNDILSDTLQGYDYQSFKVSRS